MENYNLIVDYFILTQIRSPVSQVNDNCVFGSLSSYCDRFLWWSAIAI